MSLNIIEKSLTSVPAELHGLYVKQQNGEYQLRLSDLETFVSARVAPVQKELQIAHDNEHRLSLSVALRQAGIEPHYEKLVYSNFRERVQLKINDDVRVVRVLAADGETPMAGSGSNGLATLDDLAKEAVKRFPSAFTKGGTPGAEPAGGRKVLSRIEFEKLDPAERSKKMQEGYTLYDDASAKTSRPAPRPGEKVMTRTEFEKLGPNERNEKIMKEGYRLVD